MMHINKVKTWNGTKWAVVDIEGFVVEYNDNNNKGRVAVFPLTKDGFEQAKELRKNLK